MAVFIGLLIGIITLIVLWFRHRLNYFNRRGIAHNKPDFIYGNLKEWRKTKHISYHIFRETYEKYKGTGLFAGFYFFSSITNVILDIGLVKNILIKDFHHFDGRGLFHNEHDDPLTGNLFFLDGEKWRKLRVKMTPTFTSGKMRNMFPTITRIGQELATVFAEKLNSSENVENFNINDLLGRYTADVIGACAFGLECNSLRNPKADFVVMGKRFFTTPRHGKFVDGCINAFPAIARKLGMRVIDQSVHDFYMNVVKETVDFRENNQLKRNDFLDMLIELKNKKSIKDEDGKDIGGLSMSEISAQCFVFFLAGFETSSTTMGFALYELAQHQDIQDKARNEINKVFNNHNGEFTYDCMKEMEYLDQIIDETLRMHPVVPHIVRMCGKNYETSDPKYYIEKGTFVVIPSIAIHYDPDFYPDPFKFNPDRFSPQEKENRVPCTWLPFGDGPRNCIGLRFGKMQSSMGLAYLLKNFKFSVTEKTEIPYKLDLNSFLLNAVNGIHLKVEKIQ